VSTASLVLGVAATHASGQNILVAGVAGLVAGSMSMAAGEYVSVHSQADSERAELERERHELHAHVDAEHKELATICVRRGLDPTLAKEVAEQLMAHDALDDHARDELGITKVLNTSVVQSYIAWLSLLCLKRLHKSRKNVALSKCMRLLNTESTSGKRGKVEATAQPHHDVAAFTVLTAGVGGSDHLDPATATIPHPAAASSQPDTCRR